jgi:hypothetical protein
MVAAKVIQTTCYQCAPKLVFQNHSNSLEIAKLGMMMSVLISFVTTRPILESARLTLIICCPCALYHAALSLDTLRIAKHGTMKNVAILLVNFGLIVVNVLSMPTLCRQCVQKPVSQSHLNTPSTAKLGKMKHAAMILVCVGPKKENVLTMLST